MDKREWDKMYHGKKNRILLLILSAVVLFGVVAGSIYFKPYSDSEKMIQAIEQDNLDAVRKMLDAGVSPNVPSSPYHGLWRYLNSFIEYSPDYPLAKACYYGNVEMVQMLLDYGADPSLTEHEDTGWSALSCAVLGSTNEKCVEIAELLIEFGANPQSTNDSYLPVFLAAMEYPSEGEDGSAEREAHCGRIVELVKLLLGDMDVNQSDGYTLLMYASLRGNRTLVEYLLSIGADPGIQTGRGVTAYDCAMQWEHYEIAELLKTAEGIAE